MTRLLSRPHALAKIKVVYELLPAVFDAEEAMRPGAPVVHDYAPDNITKHILIRVGDVAKGFAESDAVVEQTYSTQAVEHALSSPRRGWPMSTTMVSSRWFRPTRMSRTTGICLPASLPSPSTRCASS